MNSDDLNLISASHQSETTLSVNVQDGLPLQASELPAKVALSSGMLISRRFVALLIDALLVGVISALVLAIPVFNGIDFTAFSAQAPLLRLSIFCFSAFLIGFIDSAFACGWLLFPLAIILGQSEYVYCMKLWAVWVAPLLINHIYHVVYESSPLQATPGKRIMGLCLRGAQGQRLQFHSLVLRHSLKFLTVLLTCVPLVHMLTSRRCQLVHDIFAGSFVVPKSSPQVVDFDEGQLRPDKTQVAGIKRRVIASMLDSFAFVSITQMVAAAIMILPAHFLVRFDVGNKYLLMAYMFAIVPITATLAAVLIFALMESSALQATPGKVAAGIKVTGSEGSKVTFSQSIAKQIVQGLAYLSLYPIIPLVWVLCKAFPAAETALAICYICFFYLAYGTMLCVSFKSGQTLLDRLCERYVLRDSPAALHAFEKLSDTDLLAETWRLEN